MHYDEMRDLVEEAFEDLRDTNSYGMMRLVGDYHGNAWLWDHLVTPCRGCGSPGPRGECDWECDWGKCPGPDCGFEGHLGEHVQDQGATEGFTGAPIYWATYACGFQDVDSSQDTLERVR